MPRSGSARHKVARRHRQHQSPLFVVARISTSRKIYISASGGTASGRLNCERRLFLIIRRPEIRTRTRNVTARSLSTRDVNINVYMHGARAKSHYLPCSPGCALLLPEFATIMPKCSFAFSLLACWETDEKCFFLSTAALLLWDSQRMFTLHHVASNQISPAENQSSKILLLWFLLFGIGVLSICGLMSFGMSCQMNDNKILYKIWIKSQSEVIKLIVPVSFKGP